MRREIVLYIFIALFYLLLIGSVVFINNPQIFENRNENGLTYEELETGILTCDVGLCSFEKSITSTGVIKGVDDNKDVISEISISDRNDILVRIGDELKQGDIIAAGDGKDIVAPFDGRIISISDNNNGECLLKVLNYSVLCISTRIGLEVLPQILSAENISVSINDKAYDTNIREIGYLVENSTVEVILNCPKGSFLKDSVHIDFITDERKNVLAIPRIFLYTVGKKYYVYKYYEDQSEKVFVTVGETFSLNGEDYIEIKTGLIQGDTVISQNAQEYAERLNNLINNE